MSESRSQAGWIRELAVRLCTAPAMWLTALRRRDAVRELRSLAGYLEREVFPAAQKRRQDWLTLLARSGDPGLAVDDADHVAEHILPGTKRIARAIEAIGLSGVRLDTRLEAGQVVNAVLLALRAGPYLASAETVEDRRPAFSPRRVAGQLRSGDGVHRYCAVMRVNRASDLFEVENAYCELFYSRVVNRLMHRFSRTRDHRALLHAAPWAGIVVVLLGALAGGLWLVHPVVGVLAVAMLLVAAAVTVGYLVATLGSVQYDREHRDALLRDRLREVASLSHFPVNNPNPVIKLRPDGELIYRNPATATLLRDLGFEPDAVEEVLPEDYRQWIRATADGDEPGGEREVTRHGRTFRFTVSRFSGEPAVLLAGVDVTHLKRLETRLRDANESLEENVHARTLELLLTRDVTIMSLAKLAEIRDHETGEHLERTRSYVRTLAEHLREHPRFAASLPDRDAVDMLYRSAPLHDIGKVGVPDSVLNKPGKLTVAEFSLMKKHPIYGGDALRWAEIRLGSNSFLRVAREIAYSHHERWDGSGYPYGLAGEDIPTSARLMALADVYDALRTARPYKPPFPHAKAREIILQGRETHFDPAVVDAFIRCEPQFQDIARQFADRDHPAQGL